MFSAHLTKFKFTILAAVALLAVVGAVVALPDNTEAGRKPLVLHSVDMTINAASGSNKDNKNADMSFTWKAPGRATGYRIQRRHRINVADSPVGEAEWSGWEDNQIVNTESTGTITHTYLFSRAGKHVQWRIRLKDRNDNWGYWRKVNVSWGLKKKYQYHFLIKRNMFADP